MLIFNAFSLYGLVYAAGFVLYCIILRHLLYQGLLWSLCHAVYGAIGAIVGARLVYVCAYAPHYYAAHPLDILKLYQGGMSFHGAVLGLLTALWLLRGMRLDKNFWLACDAAALSALIALPAGRICNFLNGELYGRVTDNFLGVVFLSGGLQPRWPSQLFEATAEGPLLALLLWLIYKSGGLKAPGLCAAAFSTLYGIVRFITEFWREPDVQLGLLPPLSLSLGQYLCIAQSLLSAALYVYLRQKSRPSAASQDLP